jgi:amino acid permease
MTQSTSHHSRGESAGGPLTSAVELESSSSSSHVYHRKSASMDTIHSNIPLDSIPLSTRDHPDSSSTFQPIMLSHSDSVYEASGHTTTSSEERHLTLLPSVALVTGMMIGSGIFSSPGLIVALTGSVGASLLVWLVGGLLAWTGASSYAELGAAIPLDGGTQVYLSYAVRKNNHVSQTIFVVVIISFLYIRS